MCEQVVEFKNIKFSQVLEFRDVLDAGNLHRDCYVEYKGSVFGRGDLSIEREPGTSESWSQILFAAGQILVG